MEHMRIPVSGLILCMVLCLGAAPAAAQQLWVIDGDSIILDGEEIRLEGIDAPEYRQTCQNTQGRSFACGKAARAALIAVLGKGQVSCQPDGQDRYGRTLAHCSAAGIEANEAMVAQGMARAFEKYSGEYLAAEAEAKSAGRGLWAGQWEAPWGWRKEHKP